MTTLDEKLRRELERIAEPADPTGVDDHVLSRASHRTTMGRVQTVSLAMFVAIGSLAGFVILNRLWSAEPRRPVGDQNGDGLLAVALHGGFGSNIQIATIDASGGPLNVLPLGGEDSSEPAWSPDGSRIAMWRMSGDASGIYVADADGTDLRPIFETDMSVWGIRWAPDGSEIAFVGLRTPEGKASELDFDLRLYTIDVDGTDLTPITQTGQVTDFDWSPDGAQFVIERQFAVGENRLGYDLAIIEADGSNERPLTSDGVSRDPAWSPDGSSILFVGSDTGQFRDPDIFVVAPDGQAQRQLTSDDAIEEDPVWSPSGTKFAFDRFEAARDGCQLVIASSNGADTSVLGDRSSLGGCPVGVSWQPTPTSDPELPTSPEETTSTPVPSGERDDPVRIEGVPFPVCDVDAIQWRLGPDGIGDAFTFERADGDVCDGRATGPQYIGVSTVPATNQRADAYFGPLSGCIEPTGCWLYAALELDGDAPDELLVGVNGDPSGIEIALVDVSINRDRLEIRPFEFVCNDVADCEPELTIPIRWRGGETSGFACGTFRADGSYRYDPASGTDTYVWESVSSDGYEYGTLEFGNGTVRYQDLKAVVSDGDPMGDFPPSDDVEVCLQNAFVAPSVLQG